MLFRPWLAAALLLALSMALEIHSPAQNAPLAPSPWQIEFAGPRGLSLAYRGVPIIRRSSLYVVKPGWSGLIFDGRSQKNSLEKRENGALHVASENADFAAQYDLIPVDEKNFEMRFKGELRRDTPAQIEFAAGYFNANLIANRPFQSQKNGIISSGVVPAFPTISGLMENDLAPDSQKLEFDSRIGKIEVEVESKSRVVFADARRDSQNWAKEAPVFWLGWMAGAQPLKFGAPVEMTLKIRVDAPFFDPKTRPQQSIQPALQPVPDAVSRRDEPLEVVPRPQKMTVKVGTPFVLRNGVKVSILAPKGETRLRAALGKMLRDEWEVESAVPRETSGASSWCRIVVGGLPDSVSDATSGARGDSWASKTEAYRLRADKNGIEIEAPTARGAFYGIQTLAQLIRPDGKNARVAPVEIEDYPSLQFRGAHWFPSQSGVPFHKRLIQVMARAKMNAAVIQCEAARWDSHPEIAAPNSISKADLRALVALCRANFIEPIPLINTPGHAEWMFRGGQNLDLAEDPQNPYAYAVNNPQSSAFIQQILAEAIEVFQPQTFHIGHDEVTLRGRFPNPDNRFHRAGESATDLVMKNLTSLHDWLGAQGIKTMVWSDMFLHPDEGADAASAPSVAEARKRRQMLPKDVTVVDWHYGSNAKYPSLELFKKDGLQTVAATWNTPQNIRNFSRAAQQNGSLGLLQTTWAGYFPDAGTLDSALSQFTAFVLAGDYAWSNRSEAPDALPYDVVAQWSAAYAPQKGGQSSGAPLDLSAAAQVAPENWLGLGAGRDLSAIFHGPDTVRRFDSVAFQIPAQKLVVLSKAPREMAPQGALGDLTVEIGARAREIALLHATLWSVPDGVTAAKMSVAYADGSQSSFDFNTGRTIASWQSEAVALNARRGWQGQSPDGTPQGLRVTRWQNPFPAKTIARIRFEAVDGEAGYVLAGLTLVE